MKCADCKTDYPIQDLYYIAAPIERQQEMYQNEPHKGRFYLCTKCWDQLVGSATLMWFR